ncbi:MAG TPA: glycosyltransferase [Bacteroidales bacterium]|nr:glycosyltransferase [Bacteroidales bacterium]
MEPAKNILICPLEWGLGHAARMIPLATRLMNRNCRVFIGAGEKHIALIRAELPGLTFIRFPGFSPSYSKYLPQYFAMLLKSPVLLFHIIREHRLLNRILKENKIDIVISDNRFGLWNSNVTCVYVTHILRIPLPPPWKIFEHIGILLHRMVIKKYDYCMIPDLPGELNLSGKLSHDLRLTENVRYTGLLSRFDKETAGTGKFSFRHNSVVLSGPEPQRSIMKAKLVKALHNCETPTVILEGNPEKAGSETRTGNIIFHSHLKTAEMKELLTTSNIIISRSGYTTIMDLVFLNRSGLLIPTPGQTEQEYLAEYLSARGWFKTLTQKRIDENIGLEPHLPSWPSGLIGESKVLLDKFLDELLEENQEKSSRNKAQGTAIPNLPG